MGKNPHANGGKLTVPLDIPDFAAYAVSVPEHDSVHHESTRALEGMLRDIYYSRNPKTFRLFCPDETNSNRLGAVFDVETRCFQEPTIAIDDHVSAEGRVMDVLSEHNCEGWLEGYVLTGRHGLFANYEAFALIVASMATQHAKWLATCASLPWREPVPSLTGRAMSILRPRTPYPIAIAASSAGTPFRPRTSSGVFPRTTSANDQKPGSRIKAASLCSNAAARAPRYPPQRTSRGCAVLPFFARGSSGKRATRKNSAAR